MWAYVIEGSALGASFRGCAGLGSFHVRKYLTHRPAADLPPASLPGADVERLLGYLAAKLGKQPGAHLDRRTVDHPEWDFVGDLQLGRRPPPPTPGLSVPFTLSLWVEGQTSALHPADGARLFAETVAARGNVGRSLVGFSRRGHPDGHPPAVLQATADPR